VGACDGLPFDLRLRLIRTPGRPTPSNVQSAEVRKIELLGIILPVRGHHGHPEILVTRDLAPSKSDPALPSPVVQETFRVWRKHHLGYDQTKYVVERVRRWLALEPPTHTEANRGPAGAKRSRMPETSYLAEISAFATLRPSGLNSNKGTKCVTGFRLRRLLSYSSIHFETPNNLLV
jgi:hypothetical protein